MFDPNAHMMKLKGKDYLQVAWRLVWFREDYPLWCINTELLAHDTDAKHAIFKATIFDDNGIQKSSGFGSESVKDFGDYIEKAETKAVGRALAMLGYGTQFAPDLDEGERIVDSPVGRKSVDEMSAALAETYGTNREQEAARQKLLAEVAAIQTLKNITDAGLEASCRKTYKKGLRQLDNAQLAEVLEKLTAA